VDGDLFEGRPTILTLRGVACRFEYQRIVGYELQDSKQGPLEYEAGMLTTSPRYEIFHCGSKYCLLWFYKTVCIGRFCVCHLSVLKFICVSFRWQILKRHYAESFRYNRTASTGGWLTAGR